ncbi:unnamed protein product [Heterobilharzia americana]|nr:unnamed protein product [Heterobilharzia americana]
MNRRSSSKVVKVDKPKRVTECSPPLSQISLNSPRFPFTHGMVRQIPCSPSSTSISLAALSLEDKSTSVTNFSVSEEDYSQKRFPCKSVTSDFKSRRHSLMESSQHEFGDNMDNFQTVNYYFVESKSLKVSKRSCVDYDRNWSTYLYRIFIDETGNKYSFF